MTAHGDGDPDNTGNCRLDFIVPTSNMQLHTLVSSMANGIRMKKKGCDTMPNNGGDPSSMNAIAECVNENIVQSDVM
jgi:hypothetical protein